MKRSMSVCWALVAGTLVAATVGASARGVEPGVGQNNGTLILEHRAEPTPRKEFASFLESAGPTQQGQLDALQQWIKVHYDHTGTLDDSQIGFDDLDAGELSDAIIIARQEKMTLESAANLVGDQDAYVTAHQKLQSLFPLTYAGITLGDGEPSLVRFNESAPREALEIISSLPGAMNVEVGEFLPEAKWQPWVDKVQSRLSAIAGPVEVAFNDGPQEFDINVRSTLKLSDLTLVDAVGDLPAGTRVAPIRRTLTENERQADQDGLIRGGGYLDSTGCTAGFVVRHRTTGAKRLSTAGHCPVFSGATVDVYRLPWIDGGDETAVAYQGHVFFESSTPDFAFPSVGNGTPYPSFYATPTEKRSVVAYYTIRPARDTWVCHFGRATYNGTSCGKIAIPVINLPREGGRPSWTSNR